MLGLERISVDLPALLECALRPLMDQARSVDVALHFETGDGVPATVCVDGFKVAWAVTVLAGNALRYTRHGGRRLPGGTIRVSVWYREPVDEIVISVRDDGPGIPPVVLDQLLSRELSTVRVPSLNLLLVEDIVRAHGGSMEIQTDTEDPDRGTCVTLRLPASA